MKVLLFCLLWCLFGSSLATEPAHCRTVRIINPGWSNIEAISNLTANLLNQLGYETVMQRLPPGLIYASLAQNNSDVYMANWIPNSKVMRIFSDFKIHNKEKLVDLVKTNQTETKRTLVANQFAIDLGITSFADIAKHRQALNNIIYGNPPGIEHNNILHHLVDENIFDLGGFSIAEIHSEELIIQQLRSHQRERRPMILLGLSPSPMNSHFNLTFLSGGEEYFGKDFGRSDIFTTTRLGYTKECPNVGQLLKNISLTPAIENTLANAILFEGQAPKKAAEQWLKKHPKIWKTWLKNVSPFGQ